MSVGKVNQKKRIGWVDVFRGLGIMFMILGHVNFTESFNIYIHAFHMPMFFFVTGYFYGMKKMSYKDFLLHDLRTLIIPYFVFFLLFQPLHYIYTKEFDFYYMIKSFFSSNHNRIDVSGVLWFLLCLFTCKQIFYWLEKILHGYALTTMIVLLTLLGNLVPVKLPLCMDSALSCLAVLYAGYLVKKYSTNIVVEKMMNIPIIINVLLMILNVVCIFLNEPVNIRTNDYGNILLYWTNCILAIFCWINWAKYIEKSSVKVIRTANRALQYLGKNSIVYLTLNEMAIAGMIFTLGFGGFSFTNDLSKVKFFLLKSVVLVGVFVLVTLTNIIVDKTKLKIFFGKSI